MEQDDLSGIDGNDGTEPIGIDDDGINHGGDGSGGDGGGSGTGFQRLSRNLGSGARAVGIEIGGRIRSKGQPKTPNEIGMGPFLRAANAPERKPRIPSAPSKSQPRGKSTPEDEEDLKNVIGGLYGGMAMMTGFNGWAMSEEECEVIAKPAARILARHTVMQSYVREVADPFALVVAVGLPTVMRYQMWRDFVGMKKELTMRGLTMEDVQRVQPPAASQPQPVSNGPARPASSLWKAVTPETTRLSSIV